MHHRRGTFRNVSVALTSTLIAEADRFRRFLEVQNGGVNGLWIAFGRAAVLGADFMVADFNKAEKFRYEDLGALLTLDVYAISVNDVAVIAVLEGFAYSEGLPSP